MFLRGNFLVESALMVELLSLLLPSRNKVHDETTGCDVLTEQFKDDAFKLQDENHYIHVDDMRKACGLMHLTYSARGVFNDSELFNHTLLGTEIL